MGRGEGSDGSGRDSGGWGNWLRWGQRGCERWADREAAAGRAGGSGRREGGRVSGGSRRVNGGWEQGRTMAARGARGG